MQQRISQIQLAAPVSIPSIPEILRGKIINVAEVSQQRWIEESGQCLENVDWTHLVLAEASQCYKKVFKL